MVRRSTMPVAAVVVAVSVSVAGVAVAAVDNEDCVQWWWTM